MFKKVIIIALVLALNNSELTFLQQSAPVNVIPSSAPVNVIPSSAPVNATHSSAAFKSKPQLELKLTRPCYQQYKFGECVALNPPAEGCLWAPGQSNGFCVHRIRDNNGNVVAVSNVFDL
jgi:hypothetical protein